jgi:TolA-binding protein
MKSSKHLFLTVLTLVALSAAAWAQASGSAAPAPSSKKKHKPVAAVPAPPAITAAEVQSLKDALAAQQQQIQQLNQQLQHAQQNWQQAQSAVADAANQASAAQSQASQEQQTLNELKSDLADLKSVNDAAPTQVSPNSAVLKNAVLSLQDSPQTTGGEPTQVLNPQMESPITIRFRGINITPGGYAAAEFVRRSRALGADLPTPFNSLTMPGASQSQLSEFFGSGRQSKSTVFVEGRVGHVDLSSYVSGDFLSAGVTSTSNQTNSYTFRLRQAWAQAKFDNGWSFLGGQTWSLVTEDAKGIAPDDDMGKTNDVRPKTIDPSYNVGFDFARQFGMRITKKVNDKVAFAVAVENPQATLTTHGNALVNNQVNFLLGETGASNSYNTTATYSFNPSPDIIAKVAFDPGFGHYEVFGLVDRFTDRIFPCVEFVAGSPLCTAKGATSATGAYNASKEGGGFGASGRWTFAKRVTFGVKGFGGSGVGRYAPGGLSDASINPNGTLHLIKNLHGLGTLEWHGKKLDIYSYGGVEYAGRSWRLDETNPSKPVPVGYGAPGFNNTGCYTEVAPGSGGFSPGSLSGCTADTRALMEGTVGFWYRFYSGPRGRFQYGTQYSYVTRNTWSGNGRQPNGIDGMVFSSFRYYLP